MTTLGWFLAILGGVIVRFAVKGRGLTQIGGDLSDLLLAALSGGDVNAVLSRTGSATPTAASSDAAAPTGSGSSSLVDAMHTLGGSALGYAYGSAGPALYDCSGLVWAAMKKAGIYNGPRFTTYTFPNAGFTQVSTPQAGDVVLWKDHMGVMESPTQFYSALSPASGIKSLPVATITKQKGYEPTYWRVG